MKRAAHQTTWLTVDDVRGSYVIPCIQSCDTLTIDIRRADPVLVRIDIALLNAGTPVGEVMVATPAAPSVTFGPLAAGEYALNIVGRNASGVVVYEATHDRIGIGTIIAALGDSITEGYLGREFWRDHLELTSEAFPADVVSQDGRNYPQYSPTTSVHRPSVNCLASWMPRLNDLLAERWSSPVFIANEGVGGITTAGYRTMMKDDPGWQARMRRLKPLVWLIHLGVNDERAKMPASAVAAHLNAMIDTLIEDYGAAPARVVIARPSYDYEPGAADYLSAYARAIDRIIDERGLRPGPDFFSVYARDKLRYYGEDPVHPNEEGMELMAKLWAEALPAGPWPPVQGTASVLMVEKTAFPDHGHRLVPADRELRGGG